VTKIYTVYAFQGDIVVILGNVKAETRTLADRKARNLYGSNTWTKERVHA
jgi:hypothetical protein